jgi:hypothetical protein
MRFVTIGSSPILPVKESPIFLGMTRLCSLFLFTPLFPSKNSIKFLVHGLALVMVRLRYTVSPV